MSTLYTVTRERRFLFIMSKSGNRQEEFIVDKAHEQVFGVSRLAGVRLMPLSGELSLDNEELSRNKDLVEAFQLGQVDILIEDDKLDQLKLCIRLTERSNHWIIITVMPNYAAMCLSDSEWHYRANCYGEEGMHNDLFDLEVSDKKRIELVENCHACSVRNNCFDSALCNQEEYGLWAGFCPSVLSQLNAVRKIYLYENFSEEQLSISVGDLGFNKRSVNLLLENGFDTLADLFFAKDEKLKRIRGIGNQTVRMWREELAKFALNGDLLGAGSDQTGAVVEKDPEKIEAPSSSTMYPKDIPIDLSELHDVNDLYYYDVRESHFFDEDGSDSHDSIFSTSNERKWWTNKKR